MGADKSGEQDCPPTESELDEQDPQEDAGAERCNPPAASCELRPDQVNEQAHESEFTIMDELHDQLRVDPIHVIVDPDDGLPHPVTRPHAPAPAFTYDNVICLEDDRTFVELWADEMPQYGWFVIDPEQELEQLYLDQSRPFCQDTSHSVSYRPSAGAPPIVFDVRCRYRHDGVERERLVFPSDEVKPLFHGHRVVLKDGAFVAVRPARERCQFYKRQCLNNTDQPDPTMPLHYIRFRNCTMRRSIGGAFLNLRDEAVYACDYRQPPHPESVQKHLDGPDRHKLISRPDLELIPLFGLDGDVRRITEDEKK